MYCVHAVILCAYVREDFSGAFLLGLDSIGLVQIPIYDDVSSVQLLVSTLTTMGTPFNCWQAAIETPRFTRTPTL